MLTSQEIEQIYYTARQYVVLGANHRSELAPVRPKMSHEFDRRALRVGSFGSRTSSRIGREEHRLLRRFIG